MIIPCKLFPWKKFLISKMIKYKNKILANKGFSYIELVIAIAIFAILSSIVILNLNPANQYAQARNTQRTANINTIMTAIVQRTTDRQGIFEENCVAGAVPTSTTKMAYGISTYDIASCLVPIYLPLMPFDPSASGAHYTSATDYDTGYFIQKATSTGRITITAPSAELGQIISITQ